LIVTVPSAAELAARSNNFRRDSFGNEFYSVQLVAPSASTTTTVDDGPRLGYRFWLADGAVDGALEYVVDSPTLYTAAGRAGLTIVYDAPFGQLATAVDAPRALVHAFSMLPSAARDVVTLYRAVVMRRPTTVQ
jgi:hypothetical protein